MTNAELLKDLNTLSRYILRTPPRPEHYLAAYENHLKQVKDAAHRLHQHIEDDWQQAREESADPEMSFQESQYFARETPPDAASDDHAFGSDTDLRAARQAQQQRQPQSPEPDDWNSPRI